MNPLFIFFLLSGPLFLDSPGTESDGALIISVNNIKETGGIIWVGIYDSRENFMIKENAIVEGFDVDQTGKMDLHIPRLAYGSYAVALFHDINGNGELDRNVIGIPSEPFAFSKPPRSKWRMPRFREIVFDFSRNRQVLSTRLKKWSAFK